MMWIFPKLHSIISCTTDEIEDEEPTNVWNSKITKISTPRDHFFIGVDPSRIDEGKEFKEICTLPEAMTKNKNYPQDHLKLGQNPAGPYDPIDDENSEFIEDDNSEESFKAKEEKEIAEQQEHPNRIDININVNINEGSETDGNKVELEAQEGSLNESLDDKDCADKTPPTVNNAKGKMTIKKPFFKIYDLDDDEES